MLLYIHGFNSSPRSAKGVATAHFMASNFPSLTLVQPQIPADVDEAMAMLCQLTESALATGIAPMFIGSSLGGFYATYLAETYGGRAALINPAVSPQELFADFLGPQHNPYTGEDYQVSVQHCDALRRYDLPAITNPDRFFVLLQTGDEVLDYRLALNKYHSCRLLIEPGGDHSFVGYEQHLHDIAAFLQQS